MKKSSKQRKHHKALLSLALPVFCFGGTLFADDSTTPGKYQNSDSQSQPSPQTSSESTPTMAPTTQGKDQNQNGVQHRAVTFAPHSAELSAEQKAEITSLLAGASDKGVVNVGAWADKPWTAEADKDFTKQDKELAAERLKSIENYIQDFHPELKVKTFNMTERAGVLARIFNTKEAEFKSIFAKDAKQQSKQKAPREALLMRDHGGASKAVIVLSKAEGAMKSS